MKMIGKAFILFGLLCCFTGKALSQKVDRNEKSISYLVDAPGLDKNTIHSYLFKSIALLYNDANNVIQINDRDNGIIILKGINEINYLNFWWIGMPKLAKKMMQEKYKLPLNHTIEFNVKDNKFRVLINYTSLDQKGLTYPVNIFDLIDLREKEFDFDSIESETRLYLKKKVKLSEAKISLCIQEMFKSVNNLSTDINLFSDSLVNKIIKDIEGFSNDEW